MRYKGAFVIAPWPQPERADDGKGAVIPRPAGSDAAGSGLRGMLSSGDAAFSHSSEEWQKLSSHLSREQTPTQHVYTPPLAPPGILSVIDRKRNRAEVV